MTFPKEEFKDWRAWYAFGGPWLALLLVFLTDGFVPHSTFDFSVQTIGITVIAALAAPAVLTFGLAPMAFIPFLYDLCRYFICQRTGKKYE